MMTKASRKALAADPRQAKAATKTETKDTTPAAVVQPHAAALIAGEAKRDGEDVNVGRRRTTTERTLLESYLEEVTAEVPKAFNFTCHDHTMKRYEVGTHTMPRGHAEDSFARAHGVKVIEKK